MAQAKSGNPQSEDKAVDKPRPYQEMMKTLAMQAKLESGSNFDIAANVIDEIAIAGSWEDILAANSSGPVKMEEFLNRNLNITGLRFFRSAEKYRENSLGSYAVIDGYTDGGEVFLLSTGAPNVVASLYRAQQLGLIREENPLRCQITGTETANGTLFKVAAAKS